MAKIPLGDAGFAIAAPRPSVKPVAMDTSGLEAVSQTVNDVMRKAQDDIDKTKVDEAVVKARRFDTDLRLEMFKIEGNAALQRQDGLTLPKEYAAKLKSGLSEISKGLTDRQRAAFNLVGLQIEGDLYDVASSHTVKQYKAVRTETQNARISTAVNRASLLWGDDKARQQSGDEIRATVDEMAVEQGWDDKVKASKYAEAISPLHTGVIGAMILADSADTAKAYYDANSEFMTVQDRAKVQAHIADASSSQTAENVADEVWASLGPKSPTDAVRQFDIEAALREQLKGSPDALKKGIAALRERAQAFNAQQTETRADGINSVWGMIDSGMPMRKIRNTQEWLALPEKDRHDVAKTLESEAYTRAARQSAEAGRDLAIMQRNERISFMRNGDRYLTDSDPTVLYKMTRGQVEAKRSLYGMEATQQLLSRWDALQKPGKLAEAKMDTEDFNTVADQMGLNPYARSPSEDKKRALGTLKFRTEQLIDQEQRKVGRTLNRDEKLGVMRREMAREVTVDGGFFSRSRQVPVISMGANDLRDVVVPHEERAKIVEALRIGNQKYPGNPSYAPTEDNVKRLYVRKISPAGNLINGE